MIFSATSVVATSLSNLPTEAMLHVLKYTDGPTLRNTASASGHIAQLARDPVMQRARCLEICKRVNRRQQLIIHSKNPPEKQRLLREQYRELRDFAYSHPDHFADLLALKKLPKEIYSLYSSPKTESQKLVDDLMLASANWRGNKIPGNPRTKGRTPVEKDLAEALNLMFSTDVSKNTADQTLRKLKKRSSPAYPLALMLRSRILFDQKKFEQVVQRTTAALNHSPKLASVRLLRGRAYTRLKKYEEAIGDFSLVLRDNPSYLVALRKRAKAYYFHGEHDLARNDFSKFLETNHYNSSALVYRGMLYARQDQFKLALADLNKVRRGDKKYNYVRLAQSNIHRRQGQYDEAMKILNDLAPTHSKSPTILEDRGSIHYLQNRYDEAISELTKALELRFSEFSLGYRARAYIMKGELDKASADIRMGLQSSPNAPLLLLARGELRLLQGQTADGLADLRRALRVSGPSFPRFLAAEVQGKINNITRARRTPASSRPFPANRSSKKLQ